MALGQNTNPTPQSTVGCFIPGRSSSHLASVWMQSGRSVSALYQGLHRETPYFTHLPSVVPLPQQVGFPPTLRLAPELSLTQGICFPILVWDSEDTHHLMALLP